MNLLKRSEDILPLLFGIFGFFIIYSFSLYTPIRLSGLEFPKILLFVDSGLIKEYADSINRVIGSIIILYVIYLYFCYLHRINFVVNILLLVQSVVYMGILAGIVPIPNIDFYSLALLSFALWHCYFLADKTNYNFVKSAILLCIIAFINPAFSVYLSIGVIISTMITQKFSQQKETLVYSTIILLLCGFCSFSVSLIYTKNIQDFFDVLKTECYYSSSVAMVLSLLLSCYHLSLKPFFIDINQNFKKSIVSYVLITFIGASLIGRFDYIAHFV